MNGKFFVLSYPAAAPELSCRNAEAEEAEAETVVQLSDACSIIAVRHYNVSVCCHYNAVNRARCGTKVNCPVILV